LIALSFDLPPRSGSYTVDGTTALPSQYFGISTDTFLAVVTYALQEKQSSTFGDTATQLVYAVRC
jgi:hypothetical protein